MKPTIALFIYDPKCSVQSGNGVMQALSTDFNFKLFSKNRVEDVFFDDVDMVVVPGGIGDADTFKQLFRNNGDRVRRFIADGGRYLGICMGAYWAGSYYFDILHGIEPVQYISQLDADVLTEEPTLARVDWNGQEEDMYFYDGCAFVGNLAFTDIVATYGNGDAMAVYQNRVGLIGCHPESEEWWYELEEMDGWHEGRHNELLCEFVEGL